MMRLVLVIVIAFCVEGCATPSCPDKSGRVWHEIRSAHFVVKTDMALAAARERTQDLENMQSAILAVAYPGEQAPSGRIAVLMLEDVSEFMTTFAGFVAFDHMGKRVVINRNSMEILTHELAHHLSRYSVQRQPPWLAEGIATYLETIRVDSRGFVEMGEPLEERLRRIRTYGLMNIERLIDRNDLELASRQEITQFYDTSWVLMHYLVNEHGQEFADFQRRVRGGQATAAAWHDAFPNLIPRRMAPALTRYLMGSYRIRRAPFRRQIHTLEIEPLSAAHAHALRAWMFAYNPDPSFVTQAAKLRARAQLELDEALHHDPRSAEAWMLRVALAAPGDKLALARRAAELCPKDWRAWVYLGIEIKENPSERLDTFRRAVALAPNSAMALSSLAAELNGLRRYDEALPLVERATALEPWSSWHLQISAGTYYGLGKCALATQAMEQAIGVLPDEATREERQAYKKYLVELSQTCGAATVALIPHR